MELYGNFSKSLYGNSGGMGAGRGFGGSLRGIFVWELRECDILRAINVSLHLHMERGMERKILHARMNLSIPTILKYCQNPQILCHRCQRQSQRTKNV